MDDGSQEMNESRSGGGLRCAPGDVETTLGAGWHSWERLEGVGEERALEEYQLTTQLG